MLLLLIALLVVLIFEYINGFHDAANAIATVVSTKVSGRIKPSFWQRVLICSARCPAKRLPKQSARDWWIRTM